MYFSSYRRWHTGYKFEIPEIKGDFGISTTLKTALIQSFLLLRNILIEHTQKILLKDH